MTFDVSGVHVDVLPIDSLAIHLVAARCSIRMVRMGSQARISRPDARPHAFFKDRTASNCGFASSEYLAYLYAVNGLVISKFST